MAEVELDDVFAAFEAGAVGTFRPAPLVEVARRARRRRLRRRAALAGLLTVLLAGPPGALAFAVRRPDGPAKPTPTAPASPRRSASPGPSRAAVIEPSPQVRHVAVPGVSLPVQYVWFLADAQHAVTLFDSCATMPEPCSYALGATTDAGLTWSRVPMPDLRTHPGPVNVYPLSTTTLTVHVVGEGYWLTTNGGASYAFSPQSRPPAAALRAANNPDAGGAYTLLCPGATGFEDGASGIQCPRQQLVRIGSGPVSPQPTLPGEPYEVLQGGDGRLWLVSATSTGTRVAYSTDAAKTWHEIPTVADNPMLTASPDGSEVYLVDGSAQRLWRLSGTGFTELPGLPANVASYAVAALGGGVLAVDGQLGTAGFWRDGTFTVVAGAYLGMQRIADGSVAFQSTGPTYLVGTGTGLDRSWYQLS